MRAYHAFFAFAFGLLTLLGGAARADVARIAVAANFALAAEDLAAALSETGPHVYQISTGSTGALYAQITKGAPYDLFLAADRARPERLAAEGRGVAFCYALGRLVLVGEDGHLHPEALEGKTLAMADPVLAPFGAAALEVLEAWNVHPRLVTGTNVGQAAALYATGNADVALLAASQIERLRAARPETAYLVIDPALYNEIAQDGILLSPENPAARAFVAFLRDPAGQAIITAHGYDLPPDPVPLSEIGL